MIRTIKGMVTSMLADCKLPTEYWSYAARYAAVVIMKTSKGVPTAWEALTGRRGSGQLTKVWRALYCPSTPRDQEEGRLYRDEGEPCVFLQTEGVSG